MAPKQENNITSVSQAWALFAKSHRSHSPLCSLFDLQKSPQPCDPSF